jgi:hypothetical protein
MSVQRCLARGRRIVKDRAMLLLQRGDDGHDRFDKPRAFCTLRPEATLAPEDPWTDRAFGRVVRRWHVCMAHERPQRLPPLEELPTHPFSLLAIIVAGCATGGFHPGDGGTTDAGISSADAAREEQMAQALCAADRGQHPMWNDPRLETSLTQITQRIVTVTKPRPFRHRIRVVREPSLNASPVAAASYTSMPA